MRTLKHKHRKMYLEMFPKKIVIHHLIKTTSRFGFKVFLSSSWLACLSFLWLFFDLKNFFNIWMISFWGKWNWKKLYVWETIICTQLIKLITTYLKKNCVFFAKALLSIYCTDFCGPSIKQRWPPDETCTLSQISLSVNTKIYQM